MAFTPITVTRRYLTAAGLPAKGRVRFTPTVPMVNGDTVVDTPVEALLDAEGDITVVLYANDDVGTLPDDPLAAYRVDARIEGAPRSTKVVRVPHDAEGGTVDLSTLEELTPPPAFVPPNPISISGVTGLQAALDGKAADLAELGDVDLSTPPTDGQALVWDDGDERWIPGAGGGGSSAWDDITGKPSFAAVATSGSGSDITTGTVADARIASTIARDSEVTAAVSAHAGATDPHGDRAYSVARGNHTGTQAQSTVTGLETALALRGVMRRPEDHGAVGNGIADDTTALEALFLAVQPGETIWISPGKTYTHDSVLTLAVDGVRVLGGGEVQATDEDTSAFVVTGDYVTIDGPSFTCPVTTQRWDTLTHQKLQLQNNVGCVIRNVTVDGSAAAGIFTYGASHFLIENCYVTNTRADAFHNVKGSHHGLIIGCEALDVGDDFFAAVSYASGVDAGKTHHIRFIGCKGVNTTHGRMFACAGADDVEFIGCYGDGSHAGGIIVVAETSYDSYGSARVVFRDIEIRNANSVGEDRPDHGAVIVSCEDEGKVIEDVVVRNIRITNTDVEASRQLSIIANDGDVDGIVYDDIVYAGTGPDLPLYTNVDPSKYTATNIRRGGWGWELLASKRLAAPADTSGVITFSPRRQLMVVVRINGCDAPDIPALIFNETEDNYWTRFLTVPAGSATLTNVETDAGTMLRLSGLTSQGLRQHTAMIANHPGWPKVATISSGVESGSADAGAIEIPGTGSWHVTTEQISSIELVMAGGADMNDNTEILIFGSETF